jgi:hypothetical protein
LLSAERVKAKAEALAYLEARAKTTATATATTEILTLWVRMTIRWREVGTRGGQVDLGER